MEKLLDFTRLGVPDEGGELAEIGSLDLSDGPEMLQEQADGLFADAGNLLQLTMDKRLAPLLPMERNSKTVHLLLDMRQQVENGRSRPQPDQQRRITAIQFGGAVAAVLGQPGDGNIELQILQHFVDNRHLPLAAVGDNQIGQLGPLGHEPAITPKNNLAHGSVIVGPLDGLDVEMAVLLAGGLAVAEDDARRDGMGPLQIGIVETLDMARLPVEMQFFLHGVHQTVGVALGILDFEVLELLGAVDAGAFLRKLQQIELLAALGNGEGDAVEQQGSGGQERNDYFARQLPARDMLDDMLDSQGEHVALVSPDARGKTHGRDADDRPVADTDEIAISHIVVGQERKDVDVDDAGADDDRPAGVMVQSVEPLFVALRLLEPQRRGSPGHLLLQVAPHGPQVAFENGDDQPDLRVVVFLGLQPDARPLAIADMILKTDRILASRDKFGSEVELAGTQRHDLADELQHAVLHHARPVRTEILRPVAQELPRRLHTGKMLAPHDDPRVGLVVLEEDVVTRLEGFDKRVFEQQSVGLAADDYMADFGNLPDQHTHLGAMLLALNEIRRNALAQAFGLADVDDRAGAVHELVDARRQGQQSHLLAKKGIVGFGHTCANVGIFSQSPGPEYAQRQSPSDFCFIGPNAVYLRTKHSYSHP